METDAFRSIGAKLIRDKPCSERHKYRSTAYWRCYLKKNVGTDRHPVGTNRMRRDENEGVVDTKFRYVVNNLYKVFGFRYFLHYVNFKSVWPKEDSNRRRLCISKNH